MTAYASGADQPPVNSVAMNELTRSVGSGANRISRWTNRTCDAIQGGQVFFKLDVGDVDRYTRAGCTDIGAQPARHSIVAGGTSTGALVTNFVDAWCCQPSQVVGVFEQWVQSGDYKLRKYMGLAFAGAMIAGAAYFIMKSRKNKEEFTVKESHDVSFSPNPDDFDEYYFDEDER